MPAEAQTKTPFELLRDYEKRSLVHTVALPQQMMSDGVWSGIAFKLMGVNLVCQIHEIVEILHTQDVTRVPGAKHWMMGIANVRGNLIAFVDLREFLTDKPSLVNRSSRAIVVRQPGSVVGLLVDEVVGQRRFEPEDESEENHYLDHAMNRYIIKEYQKNDEYWGVIDFQRLINDPNFLQAAIRTSSMMPAAVDVTETEQS